MQYDGYKNVDMIINMYFVFYIVYMLWYECYCLKYVFYCYESLNYFQDNSVQLMMDGFEGYYCFYFRIFC